MAMSFILRSVLIAVRKPKVRSNHERTDRSIIENV
jgi:hypothetical protein